MFKELRTLKGKSQKDMAKILNVSPSAVSHWEAGRKMPEMPLLIVIAKFFEVSLDYLVGLENY